jgi:hypothetical protein
MTTTVKVKLLNMENHQFKKLKRYARKIADNLVVS